MDFRVGCNLDGNGHAVRPIGNELLNQRIKVWWRDDEKWYEGVVTAFDGFKHVVPYDDGDAELLNLTGPGREEKFELIIDLTMAPLSKEPAPRDPRTRVKTEPAPPRPPPAATPRQQAAAAKAAAYAKQRADEIARVGIDPRTAKWLPYWDGTAAMALVFTALVTPFEVALLPPSGIALFIINRIVDCVFISDICMQFFIAYQEKPEKGGGWVHDKQFIARRYLSSWFPLDVTTAIPVDVIIAAYEAGSEIAAGGAASYLRMVRMMRLLKLARVLRASRIFRRWQSHFGIHVSKSQNFCN